MLKKISFAWKLEQIHWIYSKEKLIILLLDLSVTWDLHEFKQKSHSIQGIHFLQFNRMILVDWPKFNGNDAHKHAYILIYVLQIIKFAITIESNAMKRKSRSLCACSHAWITLFNSDNDVQQNVVQRKDNYNTICDLMQRPRTNGTNKRMSK